jgi:hypothetical protein
LFFFFFLAGCLPATGGLGGKKKIPSLGKKRLRKGPSPEATGPFGYLERPEKKIADEGREEKKKKLKINY